jgi:hypothetical protein
MCTMVERVSGKVYILSKGNARDSGPPDTNKRSGGEGGSRRRHAVIPHSLHIKIHLRGPGACCYNNCGVGVSSSGTQRRNRYGVVSKHWRGI